MTAAVRARDLRCRITRFYDGTQNAHIVPRNEVSWFVSNNMAQYNLNRRLRSSEGINDVSNGMLLRSDLHNLVDSQYFVFVPKRGSWVTHAIMCSHDIQRFYHNRRLHNVAGVAPQFLYARFAWTLFPFVGPFFCTGVTGMSALSRLAEAGSTDPHSCVADLSVNEDKPKKYLRGKRKNS